VISLGEVISLSGVRYSLCCGTGRGRSTATAQAEGWVGLLMLAGFAPLLRSSEARAVHYVVAGFVISIATLVKFFYAGFLPVLAFPL